MALLTSVTGPRLHVGLAEALGGGLVTDPLRRAPEVTLALVTLRIPVAARAAVITLPTLNPLLTLALSTLQAAVQGPVQCPLHPAVALLTPGDRVIPEGVLLALGARVLGGPGHEGGADAVPSLLVTGGGGRTRTLLTLGEPKVLRLTPLTLLANDMILAATLTWKYSCYTSRNILAWNEKLV